MRPALPEGYYYEVEGQETMTGTFIEVAIKRKCRWWFDGLCYRRTFDLTITTGTPEELVDRACAAAYRELMNKVEWIEASGRYYNE